MIGYVYSSDARAWVGYFADCTYSAVLGEDNRTLGPYRSQKAAGEAGRAAAGSYPGSHAGYVIRREEFKRRPVDQGQLVGDAEVDRRAARDGLNPNR